MGRKNRAQQPVATDYCLASRTEMARILTAACRGEQPGLDKVVEELINILQGLGLVSDGSEEAAIWHELDDDRPSHKALAEALEGAAEATDPIAAARLSSDVAARLNAKLRHRWAPRWRRARRNANPNLRELEWDFLDADHQSELREMLRGLGQYERQFVRRGRQQKTAFDDALRLIAEAYLRWIGDKRSRLCDLPYAIDSRFIRFVCLALEPAGAYFEVSPQALSRRWSRIVEAERAQFAELEVEEAA